jgi:hypothetical protein
MAKRKKIEVFSAGCRTCREAIEMVRRIAGTDHDVEVLDMHKVDIVARAARHGIRSVPSVMVDGHLAACCAGRGVDEAILRSTIA